MAIHKLEERLASLEAEVANIKNQRQEGGAQEPWWNKVRGRFHDDPAYDEAMRYGQEYRDSLREAKEEQP